MDAVSSVGCYIRVSTQEQSSNGLSLESQQQDLERYCAMHGYERVVYYIDKGITARKKLYKRKRFMDMMRDVENGKINHIVVIRLDRFFRNVYDYHRMMNDYLIPNNCGWSAVKEEYDTTTTNGRLMINLRLSIAEQECDQDSDRIKDVFANRIAAGYVVTGVPPLGYKIVDKRLVPSEQADIVKDIFDTYLSSHSIRITMNEINERHGLSLGFDAVNRTLQKEIYLGKYRDNDTYCEPIIDEKTFKRAQQMRKDNTRVRSSERRTYVFAGLLTCAECGHALCGSTPQHYRKGVKPYKYYRCGCAYANQRCVNRKNTPESAVEEYLIENVERLLSEYIIETEQKNSVPRFVKGNREQIEKKIARLKILFVNGLIDLPEYRSTKADLESQIIEDQVIDPPDLTDAKDFLNSSDTNFRAFYTRLTDREKNAVWRSIIKGISCVGGTVKSVIFLQ